MSLLDLVSAPLRQFRHLWLRVRTGPPFLQVAFVLATVASGLALIVFGGAGIRDGEPWMVLAAVPIAALAWVFYGFGFAIIGGVISIVARLLGWTWRSARVSSRRLDPDRWDSQSTMTEMGHPEYSVVDDNTWVIPALYHLVEAFGHLLKRIAYLAMAGAVVAIATYPLDDVVPLEISAAVAGLAVLLLAFSLPFRRARPAPGHRGPAWVDALPADWKLDPGTLRLPGGTTVTVTPGWNEVVLSVELALPFDLRPISRPLLAADRADAKVGDHAFDQAVVITPRGEPSLPAAVWLNRRMRSLVGHWLALGGEVVDGVATLQVPLDGVMLRYMAHKHLRLADATCQLAGQQAAMSPELLVREALDVAQEHERGAVIVALDGRIPSHASALETWSRSGEGPTRIQAAAALPPTSAGEALGAIVDDPDAPLELRASALHRALTLHAASGARRLARAAADGDAALMDAARLRLSRASRETVGPAVLGRLRTDAVVPAAGVAAAAWVASYGAEGLDRVGTLRVQAWLEAAVADPTQAIVDSLTDLQRVGPQPFRVSVRAWRTQAADQLERRANRAAGALSTPEVGIDGGLSRTRDLGRLSSARDGGPEVSG